MILLYHLIFPDNIPADTWNAGKVIRLSEFKKQIGWLKRHYNLFPLDVYLSRNPGGGAGNRDAALTFDDGYCRTFDLLAPFLEREGLPATFFACTSHLEDGALLWFVYFNALCFEKVYKDLSIQSKSYPLNSEKACKTAWRTLIQLARASGDAQSFTGEFASRYPLPEDVVRDYTGLSEAQLALIGSSSCLQLGGHTHSHPYLDQVDYYRQLAEMRKNRDILTAISGKPVCHFAYTAGIYNKDSLEAVREAGFEAALAVDPLGLGCDARLEIPRMGIYTPSMLKFRLKMTGLAGAARRVLRERDT